jgi:hypothetical protein
LQGPQRKLPASELPQIFIISLSIPERWEWRHRPLRILKGELILRLQLRVEEDKNESGSRLLHIKGFANLIAANEAFRRAELLE